MLRTALPNTVWPICYIPPSNSFACLYDLLMHNKVP
jgi:hypothetical protein